MHRKKILAWLLISLLFIILVGATVWLPSGEPELPSDKQKGNSAQQDTKDPETDQLRCIAAMPLTQRIGQKLMAAGRSTQLINEKAAFNEYQIGGIIMMDEASGDQIAEFRGGVIIPLTVAVDQEGGTVQRYKSAGVLPGAEQIATTESTDSAYQRYLDDGDYLRSRGITVNFAPVVDVASRTPNPVPGRIYSSDPDTVADYGAAAIKAMKTAGLTPVIKHFPGLGSASANTDFGPATTDPLVVLESRDLIPYKKLASLHPDVMVGNMIVPNLTNGRPAVWSPEAISLLRDLGYKDAVIYSDSLTAEAIPGELAEAAIKAWQAGIDVALIAQEDHDTINLADYFRTINNLAASAVQSGDLDSENIDRSVLRILHRKNVDPCSLKA